MKILLSLLCFASFTTHAFYEPASKVLPLRDRFKITTLHEETMSQRAQKFMAYTGLASQGAILKMKESALKDIEAAEKEARGLMQESAGIKSVPGLPLGKITQDDTDVYVPVWTADGVTEEIQMSQRFFKTRTTVKDAKFVIVTMSVNFQNALTHLEKAKEFLKKEEFTKAAVEMNTIMKEAVITETDIHDPLFTVWANLTLAQEFLYVEDYSNARYGLKQVKKELLRMEKEKILSKDNPDVKLLESDILATEDALDKKSPGLIKKGREKLHGWKTKIKNWM